MPWTPGAREKRREIEQPYDDVPEHLRGPLYEWISETLLYSYDEADDLVRTVALDMREPSTGNASITLRRWQQQAQVSPTILLDVIESMLAVLDCSENCADLAELLELANSVYAINSEQTALEMRVAPGVKEAVASAIDVAAGAAGDHLLAAWNAAYGRQPDPVKAYGEAIKAVEAALAAHVSPANARQTLGTMIRDISAKPEKWSFAIPAARGSTIETTVLPMMRTLWEGQTSRHGGLGSTPEETPEQARAAVLLAASLVQFGESGTFRVADAEASTSPDTGSQGPTAPPRISTD